MKLSIITINYNNAQGLKKTLDSVRVQSCKEFEHVIIDGNSTDGSKYIIEKYANEVSYPVVFISENDNGIFNAMNKGITLSKGTYCQILNSGDVLATQNVVTKMFESLNYCNKYNKKDDKGIPILFGQMRKQYPNGKYLKNRYYEDVYKQKDSSTLAWRINFTMHKFIKGTINHNPTYIRRDLFYKYGLYDENLKICADWKWFTNCVVFGLEDVYYTPVLVTIFDMTGISETNLVEREIERHSELEKMLPPTILKDYDSWNFAIEQVIRLKRHKWAYNFFYFIERCLFKYESLYNKYIVK